MKVSLFIGSKAWDMGAVDQVVEVKGLNDLRPYILKHAWTPTLFKKTPEGRKRQAENALKTSLLVLDVDEGMTIDEAKEVIRLNKLRALIGTTRHHGIEKKKDSGEILPPCDRFRIVLRLTNPIYTDAEFKATWHCAKKLFPTIDEAPKSMASFFYPCTKIVGQFAGDKFPVTKASKELTEETDPVEPSKQFGNLSKLTNAFIKNGAPDGHWHDRLYRAVVDFKEQGYSISEARTKLGSVRPLDKKDMRQLDDIYKRPVKYPPRISRSVSPDQFKLPIYQSPTIEERKKYMKEEKKLRINAIRSAAPFLCDSFYDVLSLTMGITAIGGCTGDGKSTTAANIIATYLCAVEKTVLVISNEETSEDICSRVACVMLKKSWHRYRNRMLPKEELAAIGKLSLNLTERIEFPHTVNTNKLEEVKSVLEHAKQNREVYGLVIIDYLQSITDSDANSPSAFVSKDLGIYLKNYGRSVPIPVVVFVQLKGKGEGSDFPSRVQNDKTFVNHAAVCLEVISDYDAKMTTFKIHKDRFGTAKGQSVVTNFVEGRYEPISTRDIGPGLEPEDPIM